MSDPRRRPPASPLQGGSMRRTYRRRRLAFVAVFLTLGGAGGAALALENDGDGDGRRERPQPTTAQRPPELRPAPDLGEEPLPDPPPGIELDGEVAAQVKFRKPPRAGLLFDVDSGEVLWSRNPLRPLPIASLTKVMTALIVVERTSQDATTRLSKNAVKFRGSGVGVLPRGKRVPVEALLYGLLLPSGNDAAVALAERVAGSDRRFARVMTRRAKELGLNCTSFVDSYGLRAGNASCAADLAALSRLALQQPRIARIVRRPRVSIPFPIKGRRLDLFNTNPLLRTRYRGTIGLKTGYTRRAGHCLIAIVRRGGRTLGAILLDSPNTASQAKRMIAAGFRAVGQAGAP